MTLLDRFRAYEETLAMSGSGLTAEQMTGAGIALGWVQRDVGEGGVAEVFEGVSALVQEHEGKSHCHRSGPLLERLRGVLSDYHAQTVGSLSRAKAFRDDVLVLLRALALVAESVGSAATHAEKAARCRGLVELLEGGISRLRKEEFDLGRQCFYHLDDVFRSDYPTRELLRRIHELEEQVKAAHGQGAAPAGEAGGAAPEESAPW